MRTCAYIYTHTQSLADLFGNRSQKADSGILIKDPVSLLLEKVRNNAP